MDVKNHNDRTWFDMAGNFHSEALHLVERYTMRDANTIDYEVTIDDAKVFTRTWTIKMPLHRQTDADRIFEYQCQAEAGEASGAFEPIRRRGTPDPSDRPDTSGMERRDDGLEGAERKGEIKRMPDGKLTCRVTSCPTAAVATTDLASTNRTSSRRAGAV